MTGQKKIDYLQSLLQQIESQILGAPLAETELEEDTSEHQLFALRKWDKIFEEAKQAFARWKVSGKRLKEVFKKATSDETQVKDENAEEPDGERDRRQRQRSKDKDKISTNDAKSLKPELSETNLPPLQIKDWYRKWENYQLASGWGQGENHRTQLAYLHT